MENKKTKIVSMIAIIALVLTLVTATYAYFQAQTGEGSQADVKINANGISFYTSAVRVVFNLESSITYKSGSGTMSDPILIN